MTWKKGQSGNPKGRPRKPEIEELRYAIKTVEKEKGSPLLIHLVRRAYRSDPVLIALIRKIVPDLQRIESEGSGFSLISIIEKASEIREKFPSLDSETVRKITAEFRAEKQRETLENFKDKNDGKSGDDGGH